MKLRTSIVLIAVIPLLILGLLTYFFTSKQAEEGIVKQLYSGMKATATVVINLLDKSGEGDYQVKNNELYKGNNTNLTDLTVVLDEIREQSGFDVTIFYGDTRYLTTIQDEAGVRQIGTKASDEIINTVLKQGNNYQSNDTQVLNKRYICYYAPMCYSDSNEIVGMVFIGKKYEDIRTIIDYAKFGIGIRNVIIISITILFVYLVAYKIVRAISHSISYVTEIGNGKLGFEISKKLIKRKDVIGDMCRSVQDLEQKLTDIVKGVKEQCEVLKTASDYSNKISIEASNAITQIDNAVQNIAQTSTSQADDASNAGNHVTQMGDIIEETETQIENLEVVMSTMVQSASNAQSILNDLNENTQEVQEAIHTISTQTNQTNSSAKQMSDMVEIITNMASQTSLLSLNASIEAAKAGESGKGFSVVASEIKKLAEQSNKAAAEIQQTLNKLLNDSDNSVKTMNEVQQIIALQNERISNTNTIFQEIETGMINSIDEMTNIKIKTESLDKTRVNTVETVQSVVASAQENAADTQQAAAFAEQVTNKVSEMTRATNKVQIVVEKLEEKIQVFRFE